MDQAWMRYAEAAAGGELVVCDHVRRAARRFLDMAAADAYEFRPEAVWRVIGFFGLLRHYLGKHAGKPFVLEDWQQFIIAAMYGFYHKGTNLRVVRSAYIEMARKQGKTALGAGLSLYHEIADGEAAAEVYLAANSRDQAKVAFKMCDNFAQSIDPKGRHLSRFRDTINFHATRSTLRVLAADATKLDGPNPSMFLLDEYHAARDTSLKDVLQSGQGMRLNPMQLIITTAGFDKLSPCYAMRTTAIEILRGLKSDDSFFSVIYTLDDDDDWRDEAVWPKSNPNLGITVRPDFLREQVTKALNSPAEEVGVKTKNFNVWCESEEVWIPDHYVLDACCEVDMAAYEGRECYVGVDLAATSDLTAVAFMFPDGDKVAFKLHYFLPEAALVEKRFRIQYGEWRRRGWLHVTPGNVTDYDFVLNLIADAMEKVDIVNVGYDSWNATQFVINATERGLPMQPYSQSIGNFNKPTKELERLMLSGKVMLDNNEITRHCFRNVSMARDRNGNSKPSRISVEKKIDGVIAAITALGMWLDSPRYGEFY